jgi:hypothetical protein
MVQIKVQTLMMTMSLCFRLAVAAAVQPAKTGLGQRSWLMVLLLMLLMPPLWRLCLNVSPLRLMGKHPDSVTSEVLP